MSDDAPPPTVGFTIKAARKRPAAVLDSSTGAFAAPSRPSDDATAGAANVDDMVVDSVPIRSTRDVATTSVHRTAAPPLPDLVIAMPVARGDVNAPMLLRNRIDDASLDDEARFRHDVLQRPESTDLQGYDRIPVERFGEGMLRGMGWRAGAPIGLSNAQVIQPVEYVPRGYRLGLGAAAPDPNLELPSMTGKKKRKNRDQPDVLVDRDTGKVRHVKGIDEKLDVRKTLAVGSLVLIESGPHKGLVGKVQDCPAESQWAVRLQLNDEQIRVSQRRLVAISSKEFEKKSKRLEKSKRSSSSVAPDLEWVVPGIRVRLVHRGPLYLKKGTVDDVTTRSSFTLIMDENQSIVENVTEQQVETVVPNIQGSRLLIVFGRHRGRTCVLLERRQEYAQVLLDATEELPPADYNCRLGNLSELVNAS